MRFPLLSFNLKVIFISSLFLVLNSNLSASESTEEHQSYEYDSGADAIIEVKEQQEKNIEKEKDLSGDAVFNTEAELGYIFASGNSKTRTWNGRFHTDRESRKHKHDIDLEALNATRDGQSEIEQYYAKLELGKKINRFDTFILKSKYETDRFSSYEYQSSIALVFKRRLFENGSHYFETDAGPGYRRARIQDGKVEKDFILSVGIDYQYPFNTISRFTQSIDVEVGEENTSTRATSAFNVQVAERLALRLGLTARFNSRTPDQADSDERISSMTLVYAF